MRRTPIVVALLVWSMSATSAWAERSCRSECTTAGDQRYCEERCEEDNRAERSQRQLDEMLENQRNEGPRAPLAPTVLWGHLAFDMTTGRWGRAWGYSNGVQPRAIAFNECRKAGGKACEWRMPIRGGCVAVAESERAQVRRGHEKSGGQEALAIAKRKAVADCAAAGGRNCRVVAHVCSFGP